MYPMVNNYFKDLYGFYKIVNINYQKMELFSDFIELLYNKINETYLGDEYIKGDVITTHFFWCLNQTVLKFNDEKIFFEFDDKTKKLLLDIFKDIFYLNKNDLIRKDSINYRYHLFQYGSKNDVDTNYLIKLYKIFNNNIKNG